VSGPKVALNILSGSTPDNLIRMIETEDAKSLSKLPKVGKKTAEQIILTLRGKLSKVDEKINQLEGIKKQIFYALVNLGFKEADVDKVISEFSETISFDDGFRQGLSTLSGQ
jgi:holliday junction DNA helicase RuvA